MTTATSPTQVAVPTGTWNVDPVHSTIGFEVKHFGVSTFRGSFTGYEGTIATNDGSLERVEGKVDVASIDVKDEQLAAHLQGEDFFDVANHAEIRFASTAVRTLDDGRFQLDGDLTLHGVTRPVALEVEVDGAGTGPDGNERLGLIGRGEIDRTEFGITWNNTIANGALVVGEKVRLVLTVEAVKEA
jgi:polyisoprenoid-binding protein YceI